jgi:hypothetical protein
MMETEARDTLKLWKSIMVGLGRKVTLDLVRARAPCFDHKEARRVE